MFPGNIRQWSELCIEGYAMKIEENEEREVYFCRLEGIIDRQILTGNAYLHDADSFKLSFLTP